MIIFVGGKAFKVTPLNGPQWGYSIVLGALSLPVAVLIRIIPDHWIAKLIPSRFGLKKGLAPEEAKKHDEKKEARDAEKAVAIDAKQAGFGGLKRRMSTGPPEELSFIRRIRGGRVSSLSFKEVKRLEGK